MKKSTVFRIAYPQERRDILSGLYCDFKDWDAESGRLKHLNKQLAALNNNFELIKRKANDL